MDADMTFEIKNGIVLPDSTASQTKWNDKGVWLDNKQKRIEAESKNEIYYESLKSCRKGHNKRYVKTNHCVECSNLASIEHRLRDPEHTKRQKTKHHLKNMYGMIDVEYNILLKSQNYVCAICKQPEITIHHTNGKPRKLAVDHCHETGKIRGLLCINCNQGIGKFKSNSEFLKIAAKYIDDNS